MRGWQRLTYYLLLNVLVSACTTLAVLWAWERWNPRPALPTPAVAAPALTPRGPTPTATQALFAYLVQPGETLGQLAERFNTDVETLQQLNGLPNAHIAAGQVLLIPGRPPPTLRTPQPVEGLEVVDVVGVGRLEEEHVVLRYTGPGGLPLGGWRLHDGRGHTFVFPTFTLQSGGAVRVWSRAGANTAVDLYWGLTQAIWASGATVHLLTPEGKEVDAYTVP